MVNACRNYQNKRAECSIVGKSRDGGDCEEGSCEPVEEICTVTYPLCVCVCVCDIIL
jgi:hypothetical protein